MEPSDIVWESLFGERFEEVLDPNLPENEPRLRAKQQIKLEAFANFCKGVGEPFFTEIQTKLRKGVFELLTQPSKGCSCESCVSIIKLTEQLKLLALAHYTIQETKK